MKETNENQSSGLIIFPQWLVTSPLDTPKADFGMRVVEDKIVEIAPASNLREKYPLDEHWERPGKVLMPGFVDAHTHLYGLLAHGIPLSKAPSGFKPFLEDFWWPLVEDQLDSQMINAATDYNCAKMIQTGTTTFYDCTEAPFSLPGVLKKQSEVVEKWGIRAILSFEATERVNSSNGAAGLAENLAMIELGKQNNSLVHGLMCFHTTFTCSQAFIREAYELAEKHGVLTHMHCSEGLYEPDLMLTREGMRIIEYYDQIGVLGANTLASQCVQISPNEISLLAQRGAKMTHMPLSNCEVGGGIAPLPELLKAGVTVGLGSDGYITDFFSVMRGAFLIHKASHCDPRVMPANLVWHLATLGGAQALGLANVGRLEVGWQADCILIEPKLPTPIEAHNLFDQLLLYCDGDDVDSVMIAGKIRKQDGVVIAADWDLLRRNTQREADRLWRKTA